LPNSNKRSAQAGGNRKNEFELAAKVLVEPAVEERIGACGRHPKEVTNSVDDVHHLLVSRKCKWIVEIEKKIEDVQWKPTYEEDDRYGQQQAMTSSQAL